MMKKIRFWIAAITLTTLFFSVKAYSQTTTQEEYNYITKGYKTQIESGLDMKNGYILKDFGDWSLKYSGVTRGLMFKGLYRTDSIKPCAIMAIYQKKEPGKQTYSEYFCIPTTGAEDLWEQTLAQLNENYDKANANQIYIGMIWALMKLSSQEITK
ncbi:MAG: hypothetical protein ABI855_01400 [Bacteroidota bacterium]